jgi:hypothetical protein
VAVLQDLEAMQLRTAPLDREDWVVGGTLPAEFVQHMALLAWVSQELMGLVVEQAEMLRLEALQINLEVQAL